MWILKEKFKHKKSDFETLKILIFAIHSFDLNAVISFFIAENSKYQHYFSRVSDTYLNLRSHSLTLIGLFYVRL